MNDLRGKKLLQEMAKMAETAKVQRAVRRVLETGIVRPMPKKKAPTRGTGNPSDDYLADNYDRVHLRLPKGYLAALEEEATEDQAPTRPSLPRWVADAIDRARKRKGKPQLPRKR